MNDLKLLYTVGCSFTRMISKNIGVDGKMTDLVPLTMQWPHVLGDKFNIPTINDGLWGSSNQRSFRRLKNFLETKSVDSNNLLVIVQITFPARFEMDNYGINVEDYAWPDCDYTEDYIRLNPGWMEADIENLDFEHVVENHPRVLGSVCLPRNKKYSEHFQDGLKKVYAKTIRYTEKQEKLEEMTYIYAIQGLLDCYGVHGHIVFGDTSYKNIQAYSQQIHRVMDSLSIREIAGDNNTLDGYHPDFAGNQNVADRFYNKIVQNTDK